jgi:hypothetical protein
MRISAQDVAETLARGFLSAGNFSTAAGPVSVEASDEIITAAAIEAFSGLSLQAVGYEKGVNDPKVYIYLGRGSTKLINSLPGEVSGIPIIVKKMGAISVRPDAAAVSTNTGNYFERDGKVCCGSSCGPTSENSSGTLGAIVSLQSRSDELFLISNNHVFAGCNHVPKGQPILSPSSNDSNPNITAPRAIARHDSIIELRTGSPDFVNPCINDVALALVTDQAVVSSWQGDSSNGYDTPGKFKEPKSRMQVKKFGRTTGLTYGETESKVAIATKITYKSKNFQGVVWFTDVWIVYSKGAPFALGGDSGSLVVTDDGESAIGLVFAASSNGERAFIIPLVNISETLGGIKLVYGHGT